MSPSSSFNNFDSSRIRKSDLTGARQGISMAVFNMGDLLSALGNLNPLYLKP